MWRIMYNPTNTMCDINESLQITSYFSSTGNQPLKMTRDALVGNWTAEVIRIKKNLGLI